MNRDYDTQQKLLYEKGTYEVYKGDPKEESGLKSEDIRFEVYYDQEAGWYYVFTDYENPQLGNQVENKLVIREKDDSWKVDMEATRGINKDEVKQGLEQIACINCK
jgi:hypothetical protein